MPVADVEHERPEGDPLRGLGQRGEHGPHLGHSRVTPALGIPQVVPGPHPVEARLLRGHGRRAHVSVAGTHGDQQEVGLHGRRCGAATGEG